MFSAYGSQEGVACLHLQAEYILGKSIILFANAMSLLALVGNPVGLVIEVQCVIRSDISSVVGGRLDIDAARSLMLYGEIPALPCICGFKGVVQEVKVCLNERCFHIKAVVNTGSSKRANVYANACKLGEVFVCFADKTVCIMAVNIVHIQDLGVIEQRYQFAGDQKALGFREVPKCYCANFFEVVISGVSLHKRPDQRREILFWNMDNGM